MFDEFDIVQHDASQARPEGQALFGLLRPRPPQDDLPPEVEPFAVGYAVRRQIDQPTIGLRRLDKHEAPILRR